MERVRIKRRTPELTPRLALFGMPPLIEGEDAATYDELLAHMLTAVKPVDVIDEMLIVDVAALQWEILRWRRLKASLIQTRVVKVLKHFLFNELDYDLYSDPFADHLTEILKVRLPEDQAQALAQACARNERGAIAKADAILKSINRFVSEILNSARNDKAEELAREYARHESDAVTLLDELLVQAGMTLDTLLADALTENLDDIERIDRLTAVAEGRRNASLREIDRRRVVLAETLRRAVQEVEEKERKLLDPPAKGEKAA
jgi:hypothetical protein